MRHTFCSYHYAKHQNENLTAVEAGNFPAMIFEHDRAIIKERSQIDVFWATSPMAPKDSEVDGIKETIEPTV